MATRRRPHKEVQSSDAEKERTPSRAWNIMIQCSIEQKLYVLCRYDEDGMLWLLSPTELTGKNLNPRYSLEATYEGKLGLEAGIGLRLFYSRSLRLCKAVVMAVGEDETLMTEKLKELEAGRLEASNPTTRRERGQKSKLSDQVEATRNRRSSLAQQDIGEIRTGSSETHVERTTQDGGSSFYASGRSRSPSSDTCSETEGAGLEALNRNLLPAVQVSSSSLLHVQDWHPIAATDVPDVSSETVELLAEVEGYLKKDDSAKVQARLTRLVEKIREREDFLGYDQSLQFRIGLKNIRKPAKLDIVSVDFSFLNEPAPVDLATFKNIGSVEAPIWVDRAELAALEKDSDSLKEYGNKLLWELVITPADIVKAREVKQRSIGFAKLFGSQSMKALYGHLSAVRNNKARKYPNTKWVREMPQKKMLKRVWCKAFDDRMRLSYPKNK
ncbi:hypothetical protein BV898_02118 [Hypsibius exemplaris]|uniref:Uncharacterized protein n=1 Tax=Hypsibius exemplaris TaxID=2072580 RepID=A0A1W0X9T7_HYPEX|nr:hypothetical protein BV898_02118 [Hypsibius exemplaris]